MALYNWSKRFVKDTVRTELFEYVKFRRQGKPLEGYLCLPGWDGVVGGLDIYRGVELGAIAPSTEIIGFEYRKDWASRIRDHFASMPNVKIESGKIENGKLGPGSIDFAFLDFTGTINYQLYQWLGNGFALSLKHGASFAITLPFGRQSGKLFHYAKQRLNSDLKGYREDLAKRYPGIWLDQPIIGVWLFILKCALRDYQNALRDILIYNDEDKSPMMVFLFEDIKPLTGNRRFPEFILRKEERPVINRSKAAVKAHVTRRANAVAKKRSAAARKAWATRRANATA